MVSQWNEGDPDLVPGMLVARASAQLRPPRFAPQPPTPTGEPATLAPPSEYLQRQEGLPADFSASKASDRVVDDETEDQAESASGGSAESAPVGGTQGSWTDLWREAWQMDTRPQRAQEIFDELLVSVLLADSLPFSSYQDCDCVMCARHGPQAASALSL